MRKLSCNWAAVFGFWWVGWVTGWPQGLVETGSFRHHPDIEIRLLVAEPDVVDPVALCFDAAGRMYVVEMRDYPYGSTDARGRVRLLEFNDRGQLAQSQVFADGLSFPTSITPYNGGVLVTAPPEVIYLKDLDGDGHADQRDVVLEGFRLGVTDSNVNGLRWGLDNRVHIANGGNDGVIYQPKVPDVRLDIRDMDVSFDPATGELKRTGHTASGFGLVFADDGASFSTYNIEHIQQRLVPFRYLERLPQARSVWATIDISDHGPAGRIYPVSDAETRVNHPEQAGHFSAAGGMGFLSRGVWGERLGQSVLVGDVVGNLVHRDQLVPNGVGYQARRAPEEQTAEFIASYDLSFRPVGFETGPDGALYLVDMQRGVIEHPDYIPEAVKSAMNIREGEDRGRIYRVTRRGAPRPQWTNLAAAQPTTWVRALADHNPWTRATAQRLLVEQDVRSAIPLLRAALKSEDPLGRLHSLWTLQGLGALQLGDLRLGLCDSSPTVRCQSLLILERHPDWMPTLWAAVLEATADPDERVRFQAVLTLGERGDPGNAAALADLIERPDVHKQWMRIAILSAIQNDLGAVLTSLLGESSGLNALPPDASSLVGQMLQQWVVRTEGQRRDLIPLLAERLSDPTLSVAWRTKLLRGLNDGLAETSQAAADSKLGWRRLRGGAVGDAAALQFENWRLKRALGSVDDSEWARAVQHAVTQAGDRSVPWEDRLQWLRFLSLAGYDAAGSHFWSLWDRDQTEAFQRELVSVMRGFSDDGLANTLIQRWREVLPGVRPAAVQVLVRRRNFHAALLTAIEEGRIGLGELNLDLEQRRRLRRSPDESIRNRAQALFGDEEYSNRSDQVSQWLKRLPEVGNAERGKNLFVTHCAPCHQLGSQGNAVGPPLTSLSHRSVEDLVSNILDPNMAINPRYGVVDVETADGEVLSGILRSETPASVTLVMAQGITETLARDGIVSLRGSARSLMPEGWETILTPQQLRDLVALMRTPGLDEAF